MAKQYRFNNSQLPKLKLLVFLLAQAILSIIPNQAFSINSLPQEPASETIESVQNIPPFAVVNSLERVYIHEIEPIFARKCFSCHTPNHKKSWYFKLPIFDKLMDRNFKRALKALDLSVGFPFIGTKSVLESLTDLDHSIRQGAMPPPWWTFISWQAGLSKDERKLIHRWVQDGLNQIKPDK